jgi:F-type H+-transporting ATPase subunit b
LEALGISPIGLVFYIINFAILVVLLNMLLYKPVKNMLAQRQERIAEGLAAADKVAQEAAQQRAEFEKELAKAREASQTEAQRAAETIKKQQDDILANARQEAEKIIVQAKEAAEQERQQVAADLRKQAAELAMQITRKVVGEAIDAQAQQKLVNQFLTNLGEVK